MKPWRLSLLILVVIILQVGFLPAWRPLGVVPDLLLALVLALGLYTTAGEALITALVGGLALDLSSGSDFGLRLGFYTVVALVVALLQRSGWLLDSLTWRLGLIALLTLAANGLVLAVMALHHARLPLQIVTARITAAIVLELIVMMAIGPLVRRLATTAD